MKPFDLEKALAGEPVRCRDERYEVLQIFHAPEISDGLTVIALLRERGTIMSRVYFENGRFFNNKENGLDLFMATKKKKRTVYINVYTNDGATYAKSFDTYEEARNRAEERNWVKFHTIAMPHEIEE